ncbi:MAG TPA: hypothetical protein VNO83_03935 [Pseudonocardia sp.]|nr:hypothetical protein [Pseudonocardia sp.]
MAVVAIAQAALPRTIRGIEFNDPVLSMHGEEWSLALMCPWRIDGPGRSYTWESETIEDDAWDLSGHSLVAVSSDSPDIVDPVFVLDGGIRIEVHADTDLDPWVLRLPGGLIIVGRKAAG